MPDTDAPVSRERLLEMMTAFKSTYLLRAAIRLKVFDALAAGPADPDDVAAILRTDPRGTRVLLRALAAAGLLVAEGEQFSLPEGARELLVTDSPQYSGGIVNVAASDWEWDTMRDLAEIVRHGGTLLDTNGESPDFPYWVDFATHLTFATRPGAQFVADTVLPWAKERDSLDILDIGCGHGLFGFTLAEQDPRATVACLDWPQVLEVAKGHAERAGLADRVRYLPGDAFETDPDGEYDVIVLGNFLSQFSARRCIDLVRRLAERLRPGGRVVVVGFTTGDRPPARDYHAHMLNLLMLAWTREGELHSPTMYRKILASAGLTGLETAERPGFPLRIVTGHRA
ncbi:class I SAM-dependent methyltransferase [Streptomyces sp. NPDC019645]|uniref:class I SAM-dependent methyltransferase n=1 Tax=Streptomyces sp. NPDC019645 TaxID=3154786 RepID=UPI00340986F2